MNVAILARVSRQEQATADRHSLPVQEAMLRAWTAREGWTVTAVYQIPGESAYRDYMAERPQFAQAIRAAMGGQFDALLVYDISRLARNQAVLHETLRDLRHANVRLMVATGEWDATADPMRAGLEGIVAEAHSRQASGRIRGAYERRHALGLPTGDIPFGYASTGSTTPPAIVEGEAAAVRWAFAQFTLGVGYQSLATEFSRRGLKPHSKGGLPGVFATSSLQSIIENRFYCGYVTHRGEESRGAHEPIVTDGQWESANSRVRRIARTGTTYGALLMGVAHCESCSGPIWLSAGGEKRHLYYRDAALQRRRPCEARGRGWRVSDVDPQVEAIVGTFTADQEWWDYCHRAARRQPAPTVAIDRAKLMEERRRADRVYRADGMTDAEWERERARIDRALAILPEQEPVRLLAAGERLAGINAVWQEWTTVEQNRACRALFQDVRMDMLSKTLTVHPALEFREAFAARADYVSTKCDFTPDRTGALAHPSGYTLADLAVA